MGKSLEFRIVSLLLLSFAIVRIGVAVIRNLYTTITSIVLDYKGLIEFYESPKELRNTYLEISIIILALILLLIFAIFVLIALARREGRNIQKILLIISYIVINIFCYYILYNNCIIYNSSIIPEGESSLLLIIFYIINNNKLAKK